MQGEWQEEWDSPDILLTIVCGQNIRNITFPQNRDTPLFVTLELKGQPNTLSPEIRHKYLA